MYGKYSSFYESHKNLGYYAHAQTVSTRPLFGGGSGLGTRLQMELKKNSQKLECFVREVKKEKV